MHVQGLLHGLNVKGGSEIFADRRAMNKADMSPLSEDFPDAFFSSV